MPDIFLPLNKTKDMENANKATKVVTGKVRLSYFNGWEPVAAEGSTEKKYSTMILIPKSDKDTLKKIKLAIDAARELGKGTKFGGKIPGGLKIPIRDGDEEKPGEEIYAGHYFLNCSAKLAPGIVSTKRDAAGNFMSIADQSEVYSGCYARVSINFYPFNTNGNKGIAAGLNHIQKLEDGEPLGGRANASNDFDDDFIIGEDESEDFEF